MHSACPKVRQPTVIKGRERASTCPAVERIRLLFAQFKAVYVLFWTGGQGQGRTADLPLFRLAVLRPSGGVPSPVKPAGEVHSLIASLIQLRLPGFAWSLSAMPPQVADGDDPR
jgi:hypothetical protein